jgi:hypothetical protein
VDDHGGNKLYDRRGEKTKEDPVLIKEDAVLNESITNFLSAIRN